MDLAQIWALADAGATYCAALQLGLDTAWSNFEESSLHPRAAAGRDGRLSLAECSAWGICQQKVSSVYFRHRQLISVIPIALASSQYNSWRFVKRAAVKDHQQIAKTCAA